MFLAFIDNIYSYCRVPSGSWPNYSHSDLHNTCRRKIAALHMACKGSEKWSFDVLAGAAVLLYSPQPCCCHHSSAADYAAEFCCAFGVLRDVLIRLRHRPSQGPFPIGGTANIAAMRAFAEIEHWLSIASNSTDDISATCTAPYAQAPLQARSSISSACRHRRQSVRKSLLSSRAIDPQSEEDEKITSHPSA
jgi:hypothetical protein